MLLHTFMAAALVASLTNAWSLPFRRQDVGVYTTFLIDDSCDAKVVQKAHDDARMMAKEVLDVEHDELSTLAIYTMPWSSQSVMDYFGSPSSNSAYREHILRTVVLASEAYKGWGISDWWNDRYVTITCNDPANDCGPTSPGYTLNDESKKYPIINYCPSFFNKLKSHDAAWSELTSGPAERKQNIRNLRSQATTALHELLHINSHWTSNLCAGGCKDTYQYLKNKEKVRTYKAGRAKLLARRDEEKASMTNDNYAYWVMARFVEKKLGVYPQYPVAWDPAKSRKENEDIEKAQPGVPSSTAFDIEDSGIDADSEPVSAAPAADDTYPDWYKPVLDAMGSNKIGSKVKQPADVEPKPLDPSPDSIVCETTNGSPLYFDCVHAFSFNEYRSNPAYKGKKNEDYWQAYVMTCAINVRYHEDWKDDCKATLGDVMDHAASLFHKCTHGQLGPSGRCGGHVPFTVPNCPGDVQIIHTPLKE